MIPLFVPDKYYKTIYHIDYEKLYKQGIKCILFDLDNTLVPANVNKASRKLKKLFYDLKVIGFKIIIMSNSSKNRVSTFKNELLVDSIFLSNKPKPFKFEKIMQTYNLKENEIVLVGDELVTDIFGANRMEMLSIYVNPISDVNHYTSFINKKFEKICLKKLKKNELFVKGNYYE